MTAIARYFYRNSDPVSFNTRHTNRMTVRESSRPNDRHSNPFFNEHRLILSAGDWLERVLQSVMATADDLITSLRRREAIIADHAWRDRDPAGQLTALKQVSEEITAWSSAHPGQIDPRLRHFLSNASFAKALAHLEQIPDK